MAGLSMHPLFRVGLFTVAYMLLAIVAAIRRGNAEFVFYIAVMLLLIGAVVWMHRRVELSPGLLWGLSVWGGLHMAGGLVVVPESWPTHGEFSVLYSWWIVPGAAAAAGEPGGWLKYDQVVHAYGFGMATWLCWQGLCGAVAGTAAPSDPASGSSGAGTVGRLRPTPGLMLLAAIAGMGLGAANEVVEFVATMITVTNVGGYVNTGWDLVYNALGAMTAAILIYVLSPRDRLR